MAFHEIQFPTDFDYGTKGGPGFKTYITEMDSGIEQRTSRRSTPRWKYDVAYAVKKFSQLAVLKAFYIARLGCANGFRFKDFLDYCSTADGRLVADGAAANITNLDQAIGTGDGATTQFQLIKTYSDAAGSISRVITKPVHTTGTGHGGGTVVIAKAGVSQTTGWTVNSTSGIVTFTSAPAIGASITAGFQFDVPVRFGSEIDEELSISQDEFGSGSVQTVPLIELVSPVATPGEAYYGGAAYQSISASVSLAAGDARVQSYNPTVASLAVTLPPLSDMQFGGPAFYIINENATNTLALKKQETGATLATMPAAVSGSVVWDLIVKKDGSGNKVWDWNT